MPTDQELEEFADLQFEQGLSDREKRNHRLFLWLSSRRRGPATAAVSSSVSTGNSRFTPTGEPRPKRKSRDTYRINGIEREVVWEGDGDFWKAGQKVSQDE